MGASKSTASGEQASKKAGITYKQVLEESKLTKFSEALVEAGFSLDKDASIFVSADEDKVREFAKQVGMKSGHRARLLRIWRQFREKAEDAELKADAEADRVAVASLLPFASFLSSMDVSDAPAIMSCLRKATDKALKIRATFERFDENKDKIIDKKEFQKGFNETLQLSNEWLVPYVDYMAANPPKRLAASEALWLKQAAEYLRQNFVGKIYPTIAKDFTKGSSLKESFERCDLNSDGKIDLREFTSAVVCEIFRAIDEHAIDPAAAAAEKKRQSDAKSKVKPLIPKPGPRIMVNRPPPRPRVAVNRPPPRPRVAVNRPPPRPRVAVNVAPPRGPPRRSMPPPQRIIEPDLDSDSDPAGGDPVSSSPVMSAPPFPIRTISRGAIERSRFYGREFGSCPENKSKTSSAAAKGIKINVLPEIIAGAKGASTDWSHTRPLPSTTTATTTGKATATQSAQSSTTETKAKCAALTPELSSHLREAWLHQAKCEHASVASFANHTIELMKFGAPAEFVQGALVAGQDEIRHARMCFEFATRFDPQKRVFAPGDFPIGSSSHVADTLVEMAEKMASEGCYGETIGTVYGAKQLSSVRDPAVRKALETIIAEEATHALLAWNAARWAVKKGGKPVLVAITGVVRRATARAQLQRADFEKQAAASKPEHLRAKKNNESVWRQYGVLSDSTLRAVEIKEGAQLMEALLGALDASTRPSKPTEGKQNTQAEWQPLKIIQEMVNKLAQRKVL